MLRMLNLHALALRGDGLCPELKRVFEEHARPTMLGPDVVAFDAINNMRLSGPPATARATHDLSRKDGALSRWAGRQTS